VKTAPKKYSKYGITNKNSPTYGIFPRTAKNAANPKKKSKNK